MDGWERLRAQFTHGKKIGRYTFSRAGAVATRTRALPSPALLLIQKAGETPSRECIEIPDAQWFMYDESQEIYYSGVDAFFSLYDKPYGINIMDVRHPFRRGHYLYTTDFNKPWEQLVIFGEGDENGIEGPLGEGWVFYDEDDPTLILSKFETMDHENTEVSVTLLLEVPPGLRGR